jgi:diguanylate cyclase (GGDEF)-like protein
MFSVYHREPHTPVESERAVVGRATHLAAIAFDRADAADRLGFLALHDPLTELPNRTLVVDRLTQVLLRLDRRRSTTAVLVLDLDRFTVINDSFGHDAGDELLVAVANRLVETVRPGDTVGRLGGDEFVIVCEDAGDDEGAEPIAERLAQAVAEPVSIARGDVVVTASVGIAISRSTSDRADGLLRDADAALYRAKAKGGARHELFDEAMHTSAVVRLLTERALRRAIDHDELRVWYQPQIDIATRETVAVEALVRWQHPVRGIVGPNEFIDVAEETGLIVPIGAWVLDQACAQTAAWRGPTSLGRPRTVSVNLSARQLARPDLPERIAAILRERGTDPETVCLEITESVLLDDLDSTADAVRALKDLGLRLAIDDFGTGYSSLAYLKRFSFDELKIDRSFVDGVGEDETDDAIVAATIDLAHALGLVVAAEGIETEAQFERLAELGCDLVQGYLFARPQPASALTEFAAGRWNRRIA